MSEPTNTQIVALLNVVLGRFDEFIVLLREWSGGSANGGPNSDGFYPLPSENGSVSLLPCPAKLSDTVSGPAGSASQAAAAAAASEGQAASALATVQGLHDTVSALKAQCIAARDLASTHAQNAANDRAAIGDVSAALAALDARISALET